MFRRGLKLKIAAAAVLFGFPMLMIFAMVIPVATSDDSDSSGAAIDSIENLSLEDITITGTYDGSAGTITVKGDSIQIDGIEAKGSEKNFTANKSNGNTGKRVDACYTTYGPPWDAMEGGNAYAWGGHGTPEEDIAKHTNQVAYTVAAPSDIPFGTWITVGGTGDSRLDGKRFQVKDRGGAINVQNGVYHFDILIGNRTSGGGGKWGEYNQVTSCYAIIGGGQNARLTGTIKVGMVIIKGTINDVEVWATGKITDGKFEAKGWMGDGASLMGEVGQGLNDMIEWAMKIANDDTYGYRTAIYDKNNPDRNRYCHICTPGNSAEYDCSSFVTAALAHGYGSKGAMEACKSNHSWDSRNFEENLKAIGWTKVPDGMPLIPGDILIRSGRPGHVALYIGNGQIVQAAQDKDGVRGDSSGREIATATATASGFGGGGWNIVMRAPVTYTGR